MLTKRFKYVQPEAGNNNIFINEITNLNYLYTSVNLCYEGAVRKSQVEVKMYEVLNFFNNPRIRSYKNVGVKSEFRYSGADLNIK